MDFLHNSHSRLTQIYNILSISEGCDPHIKKELRKLASRMLDDFKSFVYSPPELLMPTSIPNQPKLEEVALTQTQLETQVEQQVDTQVEPQIQTQIETQLQTEVEPQIQTQVETQPEPSDTISIATSATSTGSRKNFQNWVKERELPQGHAFYHGSHEFYLEYVNDKAQLSIQLPDGRKISSQNPTTMLRLYRQNLSNNKHVAHIDGWKRITIKTNTGRYKSIDSTYWHSLKWNGDHFEEI